MEILLYTTQCPNCRKLEAQLKQKGMKYSSITNMESILDFARSVKLSTVPILVVDHNVMIYDAAEKWIKTQKEITC